MAEHIPSSGTNIVELKLEIQRNVMGGPLEICCRNPVTGFYRTGCCETGPDDFGKHTVCIQASAEFLAFSKSRGNDLSTPNWEFGFPGLKPGDKWCLCAERWREALDAGKAPPIFLGSTNVATLEVVTLDELKEHALDLL